MSRPTSSSPTATSGRSMPRRSANPSRRSLPTASRLPSPTPFAGGCPGELGCGVALVPAYVVAVAEAIPHAANTEALLNRLPVACRSAVPAATDSSGNPVLALGQLSLQTYLIRGSGGVVVLS